VGSGTFAPRRKVVHRSKRLSKAIANLTRKVDSNDDVQEIAPVRISGKRKRKSPKEVIKIEDDDDLESRQDSSTVEEESSSGDDNLERRGASVIPAKRIPKRKAQSNGKKGRGKNVKAS
jgi:hypothetical protein